MSPFTIKADGGEIPLGQHDVTIVEAVPGTSSNGNATLRLRFENDRGQQLADWLTFTEAAIWRWKLVWQAAGLDWPEGGGEIDEGDLIGRRVHIDVFEDSYMGGPRPKVREVSPPVGSDVPSETSGFDTKPAPEDDEKAPF